MEADEVGIRGPHNLENAMAAAAAALARDVDRDAVREGLRTFGGVPHRLERVAEVRASPTSTIPRRRTCSVPRRRSAPSKACTRSSAAASREARFDPLPRPVGEHAWPAHLVGEAAGGLAADLAGAGAPLDRCGDLDGRGRRGPYCPAGRDRAARAGLRQLRPVRRLRRARRALPRPRGRPSGAAKRPLALAGTLMRRHERDRRRRSPEETMLRTASRAPRRLRRGDGLQRQFRHVGLLSDGGGDGSQYLSAT